MKFQILRENLLTESEFDDIVDALLHHRLASLYGIAVHKLFELKPFIVETESE